MRDRRKSDCTDPELAQQLASQPRTAMEAAMQKAMQKKLAEQPKAAPANPKGLGEFEGGLLPDAFGSHWDLM